VSKKNINQGRFVANRFNTNFFRNLAIFVFIIKVFVSLSITPLINWKYQGHMWLGADGENYLVGVDSLSADGLLSNQEILNYWPAGYPILIYLFGIFGKLNALTFLGLFQSGIFSYAVYKFCLELGRANYRLVSKILCLFLLFNPTLSLSSLAIGYESLCASGYLIIFSLLMKVHRDRNENKFHIYIIISGLILSLMTAMQPRLIISGILISIILFAKRSNIIKSMFKSFILILIISSLPLLLIVRNHFASGLNVLSLNLGVTMTIGAGEDASGMYRSSWKGVPCKYNERNRVEADSAQVRCVLKWYAKNPKQTIRLFSNKSFYFWSPWIGPESKGTMARNPWFQNNPLRSIAKSSEGFNLVYGTFGKLVSWLWMLIYVFLMLIGLRQLFKLNGVGKLLSGLLVSSIFPSWIVTLFTLGDNRFRLPTMGAIVTLQVFGLVYLWRKAINGSSQVIKF
jgi:hypothetical protein